MAAQITACGKTLARMRADAADIFRDGLKAVQPANAIQRHCRRKKDVLWVSERAYDLKRYEHVWVIGAGKASASMAAAVETLIGDRISGGCVVVKYGHGVNLRRIELLEAGHPVPDAQGVSAALRLMAYADRAGAQDLVVCLMSGGGSALLPLPAKGLTLQDKQETIRVLLGCGADIHEINTLRKHLSGIKGGRLAREVCPAQLVTLILSDVVGDDLDVIASGPTVPDSSTFEDCLAVLKKYGIAARLPKPVVQAFEAGQGGEIPETPKPGAVYFERVQNQVVAGNLEAVIAAKQKAARLGYTPLVLSALIEGETRHVARVHGAMAREVLRTGHPLSPPACLLSGGETTVTLMGGGSGGRCQEFALAGAMDIADCGPVVMLSAGTDGTDGPTDAAGAFADALTLNRAAAAGLDAAQCLAENDSYTFFKKIGDLFITGPTHTNVMDLHIVLVNPPADSGGAW